MRRQVLPPTVRQQTHDVAIVELLGDALRNVDHRAAADPGEDPLARRELSRRVQGVGRVHQELPVDLLGIEDRRDEPFLERTQTVDQVT